jgi:outer membrane receptor protein involved in Fe transport
VGAIWTAWAQRADRVRFFANYRNTFKPAAVDFGVGEEDDAGPLKPETSQSYEAGVKSRIAGGRVGLEATTFLMDFANLVMAGTVNGLPALTNAGTERFKGFEVGADWYLPHDVAGHASYSLHDARFLDYVAEFDGVPTQLGGRRLEMSANQLASAGVVYAPSHGLVAVATVNLVGNRFLNKRNTALADGYATVTAGLGYRMRNWELRLDGRNLTDQRPPVSESELGDAQYYRLPARRFDVTFSIRSGR